MSDFDEAFNDLMSYKGCLSQNILLGSRGANSLILFGTLLNVNSADTKHKLSRMKLFHVAISCLRGELGVSILSLFLTKDITLVKTRGNHGVLPIH